MAKDYYAILGISKNASQDEIKRVYRKLANQYHPDRAGGNAEKFKEMNEAYQTLSDPETRRQYDQFGTTFEQAKAQGGFHGFDGFRDFSSFAEGFNFEDLGEAFSGFGDFFGGGGRSQRRQKRGRDLEATLRIPFRDAVFGAKKTITLASMVSCERCGGSGGEPGSTPKSCGTCNGRGQVESIRSTVFGQFRSVNVCSACEGAGTVIKEKCTSCRGAGATKGERTIAVSIPAGIDDGQTIRLSGTGEAAGKGGQAGDLYVAIQVEEDKLFHREGDTVQTTIALPFSQFVLGDTIEVETLDGQVHLKIPPGTSSGQIFRLRGKGVPRLQHSGRGDLLVTVTVATPTKLSEQQRAMIEELKKEGL